LDSKKLTAKRENTNKASHKVIIKDQRKKNQKSRLPGRKVGAGLRKQGEKLTIITIEKMQIQRQTMVLPCKRVLAAF